MSTPVIAIALDRFGEDVLASFRGWLLNAEASGCALLTLGDRPVEALEAQLVAELLRVTRAGDGMRKGGPKVQIAAVFDAESGNAPLALRLANTLSALIRDRFSPIFDPRDSPDQRNASLHLAARVPPLGATPGAAKSLRDLAELGSWTPPAGGYPILARIWPASSQTTHGSISDPGLVTTVAVWLASLVSSGDFESLQQRFRHPSSPHDRVSMFAAATLAIPEGAILEYARRRVHHDALTRVAARVSRAADISRTEAVLTRLPIDDWNRTIQGGDEAVKLRELSAERAGVGQAEGKPIDVRSLDSASLIRQRNQGLLAPILAPVSSGIRADVRLSQQLERLTAKGSEALARDIEPHLDRVLAEQLTPEDGLQGLAELREALQLLHARVADSQHENALGSPEARSNAADADPHRAAIEDALDSLPSLARRLTAALLVAIATGVLIGAIVASRTPPAADYLGVPGAAPPSVSPTSAINASPEPFDDAWAPRWPWFAGIAAAGLAALAYGYWATRRAVRPIEEALRGRQQAIAELQRSGGSGPTRRLLDREIDVRSRRLRRSVSHAIDLRLRWLDAIVALVNEARDRASQALRALHVGVALAPAEDDLGPLFPAPETLHDHLLAPALLARWVATQRSIDDPDNWATRFVSETWDVASHDGPCVDQARVTRSCDQQVAALRRTAILSDERLAREAAERVVTFAGNVAHALGPPVRPKSHTGDLLPAHEVARIAFIPPSEGDRVRRALEHHGGTYTPHEMPSFGAKLALICFWEDFSVESLAYGAGTTSPGGR